MKSKLWQSSTQSALHPLVEKYTVDNDWQVDQKLLGYDIEASIAHAQMLAKVRLISDEESAALVDELSRLMKLWQNGNFEIVQQDEDGHTAIETHLAQKLGSTGRKIHTGRSRNDQALVMMRLYMKDKIRQICSLMVSLDESFVEVIERIGDQPMPGYTHTQKAMPTTVGMWLEAYKDAFSDIEQYLLQTMKYIDQNPLGSAAGFGIDLNIDRQYTTKAMGFSKVQQNPMYCGLSRGLFEMTYLQSLNMIMTATAKFATDMLMFTSQEFDFFRLPSNMTTGSSIMPHKQNYDLFEIMRAKGHGFTGYINQLAAISGGVGSGYHRDLQLTKKISLSATDEVIDTLDILALCVSKLEINKAKLNSAMTEELQTVHKINELVKSGVPFRDAYQQVKKRHFQ